MKITVYIGNDVEHLPRMESLVGPVYAFPETLRSPRQLRALLKDVVTGVGDNDLTIKTLSPLVLDILEDLLRERLRWNPPTFEIEVLWCAEGTDPVPAQSTTRDDISMYGYGTLYECDCFGSST